MRYDNFGAPWVTTANDDIDEFIDGFAKADLTATIAEDEDSPGLYYFDVRSEAGENLVHSDSIFRNQFDARAFIAKHVGRVVME